MEIGLRQFRESTGNMNTGEVFAKWLRKRMIKVYYKDSLGRKFYYSMNGMWSMDKENKAVGIMPSEKASVFMQLTSKGKTPEIEYFVDNPKKV